MIDRATKPRQKLATNKGRELRVIAFDLQTSCTLFGLEEQQIAAASKDMVIILYNMYMVGQPVIMCMDKQN